MDLPRITGPTAAGLAHGRERANALLVQARRANPGLDPEAFASVLARLAPPVVEAAEAAAPGSADAVTAAAYEVLLGLVGQGVADHPTIVAAWSGLLPALATAVAADPAGVLAAVTNGAWTLAETPGPRPQEWLTAMAAVGQAGPIDTAALRKAGLAAAWRAGLAQARGAALVAARELPPAVTAAALGLDRRSGAADHDGVAAIVDRLAADRWASVEVDPAPARLTVVARVGGFRGFGGPFVVPPLVGTDGAGIMVGALRAATGVADHWDLHADRFGATLVRRSSPTAEPIAPAPGWSVNRDGSVIAGDRQSAFPALADPTSWTATADTLAVTTDRTHAVVVIAVAAPDIGPLRSP